MTPKSLQTLMADIEADDPLDFGELAIGEEDARRLMACNLCELDDKLAATGLSSEARLEMMAAIAAHTMVENMLLQFERLCRAEAGLPTWLRGRRQN